MERQPVHETDVVGNEKEATVSYTIRSFGCWIDVPQRLVQNIAIISKQTWHSTLPPLHYETACLNENAFPT